MALEESVVLMDNLKLYQLRRNLKPIDVPEQVPPRGLFDCEPTGEIKRRSHPLRYERLFFPRPSW
jgi:hypothetical protein